MGHWLYVVIPYDSGVSFECEDYNCCEVSLPEFESICSELKDNVMMYQDFLLVNTCYKMPDILSRNNGQCTLRNEIYEMAKAVDAKEVWYVEEMSTEDFELKDFNFYDWTKSVRPWTADYSPSLTDWSSIMHDSFNDLK